LGGAGPSRPPRRHREHGARLRPSAQLTAGRSIRGKASQNALATRSTVASRPGRPTICRPTGSPSTKPHGTDAAGNPNQLNIQVCEQYAGAKVPKGNSPPDVHQSFQVSTVGATIWEVTLSR